MQNLFPRGLRAPHPASVGYSGLSASLRLLLGGGVCWRGQVPSAWAWDRGTWALVLLRGRNLDRAFCCSHEPLSLYVGVDTIYSCFCLLPD